MYSFGPCVHSLRECVNCEVVRKEWEPRPCDCEDAACVHVPSRCLDTAWSRLVAFGLATYRCNACAEPLRLSGEVESEHPLCW